MCLVFLLFFFALHPSGGQRWCRRLGHKLMSALKSLQLHTITLPHSSSFLSIFPVHFVYKCCRFVHGVQRPPQEAMFVVRYTKLSTVHDFKNRRVRWQLLNSCTEHCWSERRRRRGVNVAPSFTASLPHSRPSPFSHLLLRVSDDKLAPLLVMGYCKMESRLDKPARLSFSCSLDLLLISIKQIHIEILETAIGCLP